MRTFQVSYAQGANQIRQGERRVTVPFTECILDYHSDTSDYR
jgi:hypothetical protein